MERPPGERCQQRDTRGVPLTPLIPSLQHSAVALRPLTSVRVYGRPRATQSTPLPPLTLVIATVVVLVAAITVTH